MRQPETPAAAEDLDPPERLLRELQWIRKKGWYGFLASDCEVLASLCRAPEPGEPPERPLQQRLMDLLDPQLTDADGRPLPRPPLGERGFKDPGVLGRILFGEPAAVTFSPGPKGTDLLIRPRELNLMGRYTALQTLRSEGEHTMNASPGSGRPQGGPARQLLLELRDALLTDTPLAGLPATEPAAAAPAPRRWRRWALDGGLAALLIFGVVLVLTRDTGPAAPRLSLSAPLQANNHQFGKRWGTRVAADVGDELGFRFTIRNPSSRPARNLALRVITEPVETPKRGLRVTVLVGHAGGTTSDLVATTTLHTQSTFANGTAFALASFRQATPARRLLPGSGSSEAADWVTPLMRLPDIPAHGVRRIEFTGRVGFARTGRTQPIGIWYRNLSHPDRLPEQVIQSEDTADYVMTLSKTPQGKASGAVRIGDRIQVTVPITPIDYSADHALSPTVTFEDEAKRTNGWYLDGRAVLHVRGKPPLKLGTIRLNSRDRRKIGLVAIAGTTRLRTGVHSDGCDSARIRTLRFDDGITAGGVAILEPDTPTARRKCEEQASVRSLVFEARVVRQ